MYTKNQRIVAARGARRTPQNSVRKIYLHTVKINDVWPCGFGEMEAIKAHFLLGFKFTVILWTLFD